MRWSPARVFWRLTTLLGVIICIAVFLALLVPRFGDTREREKCEEYLLGSPLIQQLTGVVNSVDLVHAGEGWVMSGQQDTNGRYFFLVQGATGKATVFVDWISQNETFFVYGVGIVQGKALALLAGKQLPRFGTDYDRDFKPLWQSGLEKVRPEKA